MKRGLARVGTLMGHLLTSAVQDIAKVQGAHLRAAINDGCGQGGAPWAGCTRNTGPDRGVRHHNAGSHRERRAIEEIAGKVTFQASDTTAPVPADATILEVADEVGVFIDNACRSGTCASCRVKLLSGG